jgi:hypothetical protein
MAAHGPPELVAGSRERRRGDTDAHTSLNELAATQHGNSPEGDEENWHKAMQKSTALMPPEEILIGGMIPQLRKV